MLSKQNEEPRGNPSRPFFMVFFFPSLEILIPPSLLYPKTLAISRQGHDNAKKNIEKGLGNLVLGTDAAFQYENDGIRSCGKQDYITAYEKTHDVTYKPANWLKNDTRNCPSMRLRVIVVDSGKVAELREESDLPIFAHGEQSLTAEAIRRSQFSLVIIGVNNKRSWELMLCYWQQHQ